MELEEGLGRGDDCVPLLREEVMRKVGEEEIMIKRGGVREKGREK